MTTQTTDPISPEAALTGVLALLANEHAARPDGSERPSAETLLARAGRVQRAVRSGERRLRATAARGGVRRARRPALGPARRRDRVDRQRRAAARAAPGRRPAPRGDRVRRDRLGPGARPLRLTRQDAAYPPTAAERSTMVG